MHFPLLSSQPANYNKSKINFQKTRPSILGIKDETLINSNCVWRLEPGALKVHTNRIGIFLFNKVYHWKREDVAKKLNLNLGPREILLRRYWFVGGDWIQILQKEEEYYLRSKRHFNIEPMKVIIPSKQSARENIWEYSVKFHVSPKYIRYIFTVINCYTL